MKSYLAYLLLAVAVALPLWAGGWLKDAWKPQPAPAVKTLSLPPEIEKAQPYVVKASQPLRLEAFFTRKETETRTVRLGPGATARRQVKVQQLKLTAIMIVGERRLAMIEGAILNVGDRVLDYRIVGIERDAVLLEGADGRERLAFDRQQPKGPAKNGAPKQP